MRKIRAAIFALLNSTIAWFGGGARGVALPSHVLKLSVDPTPGDPRTHAVRAALSPEWKEKAASLDSRLVPASLVLDEWNVDFGDGKVTTSSPSAGESDRLYVMHQYEPGFYVVNVTASGNGQARIIASIPQVGVIGEASESIAFSCSAVRTVLVQV